MQCNKKETERNPLEAVSSLNEAHRRSFVHKF